MKTDAKTLFRFCLLFGIGLFVPAIQGIAQSSQRAKSNRDSRWQTAEQIQKEEAKKASPEFTEYEIRWETIESHENSKLTVSGKDFKFAQPFNDGEAPFFNAFDEEVAPGRYTYLIDFIPNEIGEYKNALAEIKSMRTDLLQQRREALKSGDRSRAKSLYQRTNELRNEASEMAVKHPVGVRPDYEFIKRHGQFTVAEDGTIKIFDPAVERKRAAQRAKEERAAQRAEMGSEDEDEGRD